MTDGELWLDELLKSNKRREEKIREIIGYFQPEVTHAASVRDTHAPIETVEIYGLRLGIDANGCAAEIHSADGFITE